MQYREVDLLTPSAGTPEQTQYYARDPLKKVLARADNIIANCETFRLMENKTHYSYELLVVDTIRSNVCAEVVQGGQAPGKLLDLSLENIHRLNELNSLPFPIELQCYLSLNRVAELMSGIVEYYSGHHSFNGDYMAECCKAKSIFECISRVLGLVDETVVHCLSDLDSAFDSLEKLSAISDKMEELGKNYDFIKPNPNAVISKI